MSSSSAVPIDVFVGVDVGKSSHHAVALDVTGKVLIDRELPQDEAQLVALIDALKGHGRVLFVVDQPATIGALPLAVARVQGVEVGYLPGLAMRRAAGSSCRRGQDRRPRCRDHRADGADDASCVAGASPR